MIMSSPPRRTYRKYGGFQKYYIIRLVFFSWWMSFWCDLSGRSGKVPARKYARIRKVRRYYYTPCGPYRNNIRPYRNGLRERERGLLFAFPHRPPCPSKDVVVYARVYSHTCAKASRPHVLHRAWSLSRDGKITPFDDGYSRGAWHLRARSKVIRTIIRPHN